MPLVLLRNKAATFGTLATTSAAPSRSAARMAASRSALASGVQMKNSALVLFHVGRVFILYSKAAQKQRGEKAPGVGLQRKRGQREMERGGATKATRESKRRREEYRN